MDEFEVGQTYTVNGLPRVYLGGDPKKRASWRSAATEIGETPRETPAPGMGERLAGLIRGAISPQAHADAARSLVQGVTLSGGDEMRAAIRAIPSLLPGGRSPREAFGEALEQEQGEMRRIREENPTLAPVAEIVGGLVPAALPVGSAAGTVRAGSGLVRGAVKGAAVGAGEGALFGALEAEGGVGERVRAAPVPAAFGAGLGATIGTLPGIVNAVRRKSAGRGARVSEALQARSGVRVNPNAALDESGEAVDAVRAQHYGPLEQAFPEITDAAVIDVLRSPSVRRHTSAIAADVAKGDRPPSFAEAQKVLMRLRRLNGKEKRFMEQINQLDTAIENAVPGYAEADEAYRAAVAPVRALNQGRRFWNKSAADIERAERSYRGAELRQFRHGMLVETIRRLEARDEAAGEVLSRMLDAGPETESVLRTLFPTDDSYEAFRDVLNRERSAIKVADAFQRLGGNAAKIGIGFGIGAAGGYAGARGLEALPR